MNDPDPNDRENAAMVAAIWIGAALWLLWWILS